MGPDNVGEEVSYLIKLTTEQRRVYLYEVLRSRGKTVELALREALFLLETAVHSSAPQAKSV